MGKWRLVHSIKIDSHITPLTWTVKLVRKRSTKPRYDINKMYSFILHYYYYYLFLITYGNTYPCQPKLRLKLLCEVQTVVDKRKATGPTAAKVGAESKTEHNVRCCLVRFCELFSDFRFRNRRATGVQNVDHLKTYKGTRLKTEHRIKNGHISTNNNITPALNRRMCQHACLRSYDLMALYKYANYYYLLFIIKRLNYIV